MRQHMSSTRCNITARMEFRHLVRQTTKENNRRKQILQGINPLRRFLYHPIGFYDRQSSDFPLQYMYVIV